MVNIGEAEGVDIHALRRQTKPNLSGAYKALATALRPPPLLDLYEWCEENMVLSAESSAQRGGFRAWPFQEEPMRVMSPRHPCDKVALLCASQTMKTQLLLNMLAYVIAVDPGPTLFVEPRTQDAESISKDRVTPMLRDVPALKGKIVEPKSRAAGNTIEHKKFIGGHVSFAYATSPSSLAMRSIRYLFLDEISREQYLASKEGDPIRMAERRTENFPNRKIVYASSPTDEGTCRITEIFLQSDQRQWHVPCPHCGYEQVLEFGGLKYSRRKGEVVQYVDSTGKTQHKHIPADSPEYQCGNCRNLIPERWKTSMNAKGRYIPANPEGKFPGFRVNRLVSPMSKWGNIVAEWEEAKGHPQQAKVFVNTVLAQTWRVGGETTPWEVLASRKEPYTLGTVPYGVRFLTAGIDVQKHWIDLSVWGWGRNRECWLVDRIQIQGRTSEAQVWEELSLFTSRQWTHPTGTPIGLARIAIDSGYETNMVYAWARKQGHGVLVVKGYDNLTGVIVGQPSGIDLDLKGKRVRRGLLVWPVDVSKLKSDLYSRISLPRPEAGEGGSGYPSGWVHIGQVEDEFCKQLTAESLVSRKDRRGYVRTEWVKDRERNEALDEWVYAAAAAHMIGLERFSEEDWKGLEDLLGVGEERGQATPTPSVPITEPAAPEESARVAPTPTPPAPAAPAPPPAPPPSPTQPRTGSGWVGRSTSGWLKR